MTERIWGPQEVEGELFSKLDKLGFEIECFAEWENFTNNRIAGVTVDDVFNSTHNYLDVSVRPRQFGVLYEFKPRAFSRLRILADNYGLFITHRDEEKLVLDNPPIRQVRLFYLPKEREAK